MEPNNKSFIDAAIITVIAYFLSKYFNKPFFVCLLILFFIII